MFSPSPIHVHHVVEPVCGQASVQEVGVPVVLVEHVKESPQKQCVTRKEQVQIPADVTRFVPYPKFNVQERIIRIPKPIVKHQTIEIPDIEWVEKVVEVPRYVYRERFVHVPRPEIHERIIPLPLSLHHPCETVAYSTPQVTCPPDFGYYATAPMPNSLSHNFLHHPIQPFNYGGPPFTLT